MPLTDPQRNQLDGIVQQMTANGESGESIQAVVDDFKSKYEGQSQSQVPPSGDLSSLSSIPPVMKGALAETVVRGIPTVARFGLNYPIEAAKTLATTIPVGLTAASHFIRVPDIVTGAADIMAGGIGYANKNSVINAITNKITPAVYNAAKTITGEYPTRWSVPMGNDNSLKREIIDELEHAGSTSGVEDVLTRVAKTVPAGAMKKVWGVLGPVADAYALSQALKAHTPAEDNPQNYGRPGSSTAISDYLNSGPPPSNPGAMLRLLPGPGPSPIQNSQPEAPAPPPIPLPAPLPKSIPPEFISFAGSELKGNDASQAISEAFQAQAKGDMAGLQAVMNKWYSKAQAGGR